MVSSHLVIGLLNFVTLKLNEMILNNVVLIQLVAGFVSLIKDNAVTEVKHGGVISPILFV